MKNLLAAMFVALLMVGCGDDDVENSFGWSDANKPTSTGVIDLDDNETRNRIIAEAIDSVKLQKKGDEGEQLYYAPNQQTPYTGWAKVMWGNEQVKLLAQYKNGKEGGLVTEWRKNGQKQAEITWKDGKPDGLVSYWHENGQKKFEANFQDGKPIGLETLWYRNGQKHSETFHKFQGRRIILWTAFVWKPNGDKCSVTNLVNGNGVVVEYKEDGTEKSRRSFKDGEIVETKPPPPESDESSSEIPPAKSPEVPTIDLDDNETRNRIIAEAIDSEKLDPRINGRNLNDFDLTELLDLVDPFKTPGLDKQRIYFAPNQETPYTGWAKWMYDNGRIRSLSQYKDGRLDGLSTE